MHGDKLNNVDFIEYFLNFLKMFKNIFEDILKLNNVDFIEYFLNFLKMFKNIFEDILKLFEDMNFKSLEELDMNK